MAPGLRPRGTTPDTLRLIPTQLSHISLFHPPTGGQAAKRVACTPVQQGTRSCRFRTYSVPPAKVVFVRGNPLPARLPGGDAMQDIDLSVGTIRLTWHPDDDDFDITTVEEDIDVSIRIVDGEAIVTIRYWQETATDHEVRFPIGTDLEGARYLTARNY